MFAIEIESARQNVSSTSGFDSGLRSGNGSDGLLTEKTQASHALFLGCARRQEVGDRESVQRFNESSPCIIKCAFKLANALDRAGVRLYVETLEQLHGLSGRDEVTDADLRWVRRKFDAAIFSLIRANVTLPGQLMNHLHQVILGDAKGFRDLTDCRELSLET